MQKIGINTLQADEMIALQVFVWEYQRVLSLNYLSSYIFALRSYLPDTVLKAHVIQKFMKGMFRLRPTKQHIMLFEM